MPGFPAGFPAVVKLVFWEPWKTGSAADVLYTSELSGVFRVITPGDSGQRGLVSM